ncbi:STAS domain-containing protein [Streptomyces sp. NPDC005917]|uniref:STAS domain-containing protein n=1 Tax=unclassified Streptomyces TaxID=2593676 RepID=UPI0033E504F7
MTPEAVEPGLPAANSWARTRRCGAYLVVEVFGEVDVATEELVAGHLLAATTGSEPDLLVDLRALDFLDRSGLRVLCRADARAKERGGRLRLVCEGPRIPRLLRASGLLGRFPPLPGLPPGRERRGAAVMPGAAGGPTPPVRPPARDRRFLAPVAALPTCGPVPAVTRTVRSRAQKAKTLTP